MSQNNNEEKALRYNEGKPQWGLVHYDSLIPMVRVLEFGAYKYSPRNWMKPMPTKEILESMQRHLAALMDGEEYDPESGLDHMGHIQANAMFYNFQRKREREELKEDHKILVKLEKDWADEFTVYSLWITTKKEFEEFTNKLKLYDISEESEIYYGTNEYFSFDSYDDIIKSLSIYNISDGCYNEFFKIFNSDETGQISIKHLYECYPKKDSNE